MRVAARPILSARVRNRSARGRQDATVILTRIQRAAGADVVFRTQWAIQLYYGDKIEITLAMEYARASEGNERERIQMNRRKRRNANGRRVHE